MILAPLEGSRAKVWRAQQLLAELTIILETFRDNTGIHFKRIDSDSEFHFVFAPTFTNPEPPMVPLLIGDIAHNLRSSLDLMMCDIARLRGKSTDKIKFPFAANKSNLDDLLKGDIKKLGSDVVTAVKALQPYKGGNIALRGLHDLDIADKHGLVIPTFVAALARVNLSPEVLKALADAGFSGQEMITTVHAGGRLTIRKDIDPRTFFAGIKAGPTPLFPIGLPFAGEPVIETLKNLAQLTSEIVEAFIRQFRGGNDDPIPAPDVDNQVVE